MPRTSPSLRTLAEELGLSIATVSEALKESPRVAPETRARVQALAKRVSYARNPLVSTVMSMVRTARQDGLRGTIAVLNHADEPAPQLIAFHREIFAGATTRARELGYSLELFWMGPHGLPLRRLAQILAARNIQGVMVLPFAESRDLSELPWQEFSAVSMDYSLTNPRLHVVLPDHHLAVYNSLQRMLERGYRRPGLFLQRFKDRRLKHRYTATYQGFMYAQFGGNYPPPLVPEEISREEFLHWYEVQRPDVIFSHVQPLVEWLAGQGVRVPRDVGFVHLNHLERLGPCAGIEMRPSGLGAAAIESVVAQIHRNERGIPSMPKTITIEGDWMEGPTVRPPAAAGTPRAGTVGTFAPIATRRHVRRASK